MQHDVVGLLKCPACQCSISLQLAWQQDAEQQQQQRRQQLVESQTTLLESLKILDQGQEAERQGELAKAFRLYKTGLAGAILALKLWPASNPIVPMIEQCRSRVLWAMGRSEKISRALVSLEQPLPQPPQVAQLPQLLQMQLQQPLGPGSTDSRHNKPGVALGTTHREQLAQLQPLQAAQLPQPMHPQVQQQKQVAQQQAQQQQQVAQQQAQQQQQQVAQEPQQQRRQPVARDMVSVNWQQQQQQQQQQLQEQALRARRYPRQPLAPPPHRLLNAITLKAIPYKVKAKFETKFSDQGSGPAQKRPKATMPGQEKEEPDEADVDAWSLLEPPSLDDERAKLEPLREWATMA